LKKVYTSTFFLLTSVFIWFILTGLVRQNSFPHEKAAISEQEKAKYIYVGMEKCASVCHNNKDMGFQYDIVKKGPHSNSFKILVSQKAEHYAKKAILKEDRKINLRRTYYKSLGIWYIQRQKFYLAQGQQSTCPPSA